MYLVDLSAAGVAGMSGQVGHQGWAVLDLRLWWIVLLACVPLALGCVALKAGQLVDASSNKYN